MADPVPDAIRAFAAGEIIVVTDDNDREGEGDLIIAASLCTPQKMAFIIRHTSGIVCASIPRLDARRLRLDPMVAYNDSGHSTAFTVSIDYKPGMTTGISADERTATCRALANPDASASDFARPGHVFPLVARDGGVLLRSGHTEAAIDVCRLAGLPQVGILSELINDDGSVMKGEQISAFAQTHGLRRTSIADLIAHRQSRERLIDRVSSFAIESPIGQLQGHAYRSPFDSIYHVALVYGDIGDGRNVLTRLHRPNIAKDLFFGSKKIVKALEHFKRRKSGVLVLLRDGAAGVPVVPLSDQRTVEFERSSTWREVGVGAQILRDLGVSSICNLTSSLHEYKGLSGFGIEIVGSEHLED